jgi:uncharacterized protein (TIGR00369 family)
MVKRLDLLEAVLRGESELSPVAQLIGVRLAAIEPGRCRIELQTDERHLNSNGTLHGGILAELADAAMGYAYAANLAEGENCATIELKLNFLRPAWKTVVSANARVVQQGRTLGLVECDLLDADGRLLARASGSWITLRGAAADRSGPAPTG